MKSSREGVENEVESLKVSCEHAEVETATMKSLHNDVEDKLAAIRTSHGHAEFENNLLRKTLQNQAQDEVEALTSLRARGAEELESSQRQLAEADQALAEYAEAFAKLKVQDAKSYEEAEQQRALRRSTSELLTAEQKFARKVQAALAEEKSRASSEASAKKKRSTNTNSSQTRAWRCLMRNGEKLS